MLYMSCTFIVCRPFAGDGVEIGSLLVPMVLTSQMVFIERWESKFLKVTGINHIPFQAVITKW